VTDGRSVDGIAVGQTSGHRFTVQEAPMTCPSARRLLETGSSRYRTVRSRVRVRTFDGILMHRKRSRPDGSSNR
jgi:hypothetical protein